jgi:hypothetical protein
MKFHTKKNVEASTTHVQQIKCGIGFDAFAVQSPTRKKNSNFVSCTHTMINVVIIFLTQ